MGRIPSLALLPTSLLMHPRTQLAFWAGSTHYRVTLSFFSNTLQVLLLKAALCPFTAQPALVLGIVLTQVQDGALGSVSRGSHSPTSQACQGPAG